MPKRKRLPISVEDQATVYFRDKWLCKYCRRPVILHLALKWLVRLVHSRIAGVDPAYWDDHWRRDKAPLLDELAASVDHKVALSDGGEGYIHLFGTSREAVFRNLGILQEQLLRKGLNLNSSKTKIAEETC